MSWPLTSFLILAVALAAGFAWYERTHPSARVLSLVATLGAFAALGRVAFAPLPNVKPTTAIVVLSGYVLGGAPGFVVGAVGALGSNVFLGQGPWTPWQMTAWGLCGLLGAALGRLARGKELPRWALSVACGVAAAFYGVLLDFSSWVTFTGDRSLGQFAAISASSLWWNAAHVVASVGFCAAFGLVFVRALRRYRSRFEVEWVERPTALSSDGVSGRFDPTIG